MEENIESRERSALGKPSVSKRFVIIIIAIIMIVAILAMIMIAASVIPLVIMSVKQNPLK